MCLTTQALVLFLNMLDPSLITAAPDRITVHAVERDAIWTRVQDHWCTAPQPSTRTARNG